MNKKIIIPIAICCLSIAFTGGYVYNRINRERSVIVPEVTIETGSEIKLEDFLTDPMPECGFYTDITSIDTTVPGSYSLVLKFDDLGREFHQNVVLNIVDTTAPTGTAIPQTIYCGQLPEASSVVTDVCDLAPVTVTYASEPDVIFRRKIFLDL